MARNRPQNGFTLIELLVVVAIIGLLIAILLPSLRTAREQARVAKCVSNLRQIAFASNNYIIDNGAISFGLGAPYDGQTFYVLSEFISMGAMPDKTLQEWNVGLDKAVGLHPSMIDFIDINRVRPRARPMNRYISNSVTWDRPTVRRLTAPANTPDFFRCPSDRTAFVPFVGASNPEPPDDSIWPMWEYWGTSYPINWYWPYYYMQIMPGLDFTEFIGAGPRHPRVDRKLIAEKVGARASEFILFSEGQLNYALAGARPPGHSGGPWSVNDALKRLVGWHGDRGRHAAAFLDGSARYDRFDTRFVFGNTWTIWPNKPWQGVWSAYDSLPPTDDYAYTPANADPNN